MANLKREANFYWWKHLAPKITYEVDLRDIRNNPDFAFISNHYRFKAGDYGRIYDDRLGGALQLRITETETDALTGEVIKVVFGDLRGFVKESGNLPLPPFPEIPKPFVFDETKIAVVLLDGNGKPTDNVTYFESDNHDGAVAFMKANPNNKYWVRLGSEITTVSSTGTTPYGGMKAAKNLVKFTIEGSIEEIWAGGAFGAFQYCAALKYVDLGKSVINIPKYAFHSCKSLETVILPDTVAEIMESAFYYCFALVELETPSVTKIGTSAFSGSGLRSIKLPSSLVSIATNAFSGCDDLKTIIINKPERSIRGAPWGATNAQIIWTG
jgi:hypothetical protein